MAKKIEGKTRKLMSSSTSIKADKSKLDIQERRTEKSRIREKKALKTRDNEELKNLEHQLREERLKPTCALLSELSRKKYEHDRMYRDELDWKHRIQCDGTPNPQVVQELNTYLFVWRQVCHTSDNKNSYVDKCLEIFNIMDAVDDIVDLPLDFNQFKLQCFREARDNLGRLLVEIVYGACYHLLSDYERRMNVVDLETMAYQNACDAFAVGLHAVCHRPRLMTDSRPAPKCDFPECLVAVEVPPQLAQHYMAVMALWLRWDPFTDRMTEFDVSESPQSDVRDLWQYTVDVRRERNRIMRELDSEKERARKEGWMAKMEQKLKAFANVDRNHYPDDLKAYVDELEGNDAKGSSGLSEYADEEEQEDPEEEPPRQDQFDYKSEPVEGKSMKSLRTEITKTASQEMEKRQLEEMERISNSLKYPEKPNELNPRRYWIIGGAFNVEMWKLPMQPVEHQDGTVGVMIVGPSTLQPIDYQEKYEPLQLSFSSTSSEDEETDVKKQNQEALKRLTLINIKLPENVLWFENPKPAMWNEDRKVWTTEFIYDVRFNEEKQTVSFRAGQMGSFGLAVNRYSNLPFQSWEIRPVGTAAASSSGGGGGGGGGGGNMDENGGGGGTDSGAGGGSGSGGGVVLSVTAATVLVEFTVRDDYVAMVQLQNATTVALQEMIGVYHRPDRLVRLLRRGGVNLFPEPDARHYVDGRRPTKHAVAERHAYHCMAALSGTHQFTASRWNMHVAADRMVLQMKEIPAGGAAGANDAGPGSVGPYKMVMVSADRAVLLKCNEVSQAFSEEPQSTDSPFAPDLYTLAMDAATSDSVRAAMAAVNYKTAETLFFLMDKMKLLSYS